MKLGFHEIFVLAFVGGIAGLIVFLVKRNKNR